MERSSDLTMENEGAPHSCRHALCVCAVMIFCFKKTDTKKEKEKRKNIKKGIDRIKILLYTNEVGSR